MKRDELAVLHRQKRTKKRRTPGEGAGVKILWGFVFFAIAVNFITIGVSFNKMTAELFPESDPVQILNSWLLYWFCLEFIVRYMIQSLPVMDVVPFLHLPVQKSSLIRFLQIKGFTHPANYISFLFYIPFAFFTMGQTHSFVQIFFWLLSLLGCTWLVTICALHLKRRDIVTSSSSLLFLMIGVAIAVADYYGLLYPFSLTNVSGYIFGGFCQYPLLCLIPIVMVSGLIQWNYRFMSQHAYTDEAIKKKQDKIELHGSFLGKYFGLTGALIDLDIKLAWRNKRTRTQVYFIPLFLLYGFIFYSNPLYLDRLFIMCFIGIFLSGYPMVMYGQMPFDSSFFEGQMSRISIDGYVKAKLSLYVSLTVIAYIITLPYAFFGGEILFVNFACFLFNLGIFPILLLHMSALNKKGVELSQSSAMNMQGVTFSQVLYVILIVFFPAIITAIMGNVWVILGLGALGLVTYPLQLKWVKDHYIKRKYILIENFRKK
ncbi:MAG: DUF5687 family protein [Prevotellaceae bacterium]|jgi:hypothetical protein|nr:DUF5687 family protein [Prevotellaceae bacterium]